MGCIYYLIETTKWLPVLVTCTIFAWSYYAYTIQLVLVSMSIPIQQLLCLIVFNFLYIFAVWSYLRTIFAPKIRIPNKFYLSPEITEDLIKAQNEQQRDEILAYVAKRNELPLSCRTYLGGFRYCEKCNLIKPDRCHHCSICRECIPKMDHHCPWINNCVSFSNYKFFVLFLGYTFALCVFVAATTFPYFLKYWLPPSNSNQTTTTTTTSNQTMVIRNNQEPQTGLPKGETSTYLSQQQQLNDDVSFSVKFHILFLFFVSGMLTFGVMFLYFYHIYLLLNNRSTLEAFRPPLMAYGPDKNAFNLGTKENLNQLFGRSKLLWFIPVYTTEGSGLTYDLRPQLSHDEEARQGLLNHNGNRSNSAVTTIQLENAGPQCRSDSPVARLG